MRIRNERVRLAFTDVLPPTVHVPRCQSPSASNFLSSASASAGGRTRRTMCAGARLGTSASATARTDASPSLTVHGRAGSCRKRPRSKPGSDCAGARGDTVACTGAGAGAGRFPSCARSKVRRRAVGAGAGAGDLSRLRESSAGVSSPAGARVVPHAEQARKASCSFCNVQAAHTHIVSQNGPAAPKRCAIERATANIPLSFTPCAR